MWGKGLYGTNLVDPDLRDPSSMRWIRMSAGARAHLARSNDFERERRRQLFVGSASYGRSRYYLFNASRSTNRSGTEDIGGLPSYIREAPALVDKRGVPTSFARDACASLIGRANHLSQTGI